MHDGHEDGAKDNDSHFRLGAHVNATPLFAIHFRQRTIESRHILAQVTRKAIHELETHVAKGRLHQSGHDLDAALGHLDRLHRILIGHGTVLLKLNFLERIMDGQFALELDDFLLLQKLNLGEETLLFQENVGLGHLLRAALDILGSALGRLWNLLGNVKIWLGLGDNRVFTRTNMGSAQRLVPRLGHLRNRNCRRRNGSFVLRSLGSLARMTGIGFLVVFILFLQSRHDRFECGCVRHFFSHDRDAVKRFGQGHGTGRARMLVLGLVIDKTLLRLLIEGRLR